MSVEPVPSRSGSPLPSAPARIQTRASLRYPLVSLALLIPCYWQARIQAGDLSSHIYNSWLATLIESGRLPGLQIARQTTNILFDLLLTGLFRWLGPDWAQRLSVSLCVLIFAWGAFAFVTAISARPAWPFLPCIAILSYGWVFHMGFFNFYLSLGLSFWGLAALWKPNPAKVAAACALFATAYMAHALPMLWAVALIVYFWLARSLPPWAPALLLGTGLAVFVAAHFVVGPRFGTKWSFNQLASAAGADQVLVFDRKYGLIMAALLLLWATSFLDLLEAKGKRALLQYVPLHWCALTAAGICILPNTILIPGYRHALVYIDERMSLPAAICLCGVLAAAPMRSAKRCAFIVVMLAFFAFLFQDERNLNQFEDRVDRAVAQLAPGQRVVSPIVDPILRVNALAHAVDRACLGRCYSYANYEPSTWQFRVRAVKPNPYVSADYGASFDMQDGKFVFEESDLPAFELVLSESGEVTARPLKAGVASGTTVWRGL